VDGDILKDIKRWYHEHGVPFERQDWGERDYETGESAGPQVQAPEYSTEREGTVGERRRTTAVRSTDPTPANTWWWEDKKLPWPQRSREEQSWVEQLDAFFEPYMALLPRPKGNLVRQFINDRRTYQEIADYAGVKRQSAHESVKRAFQDLTRLIARDDPLWREPADGRRRDHDAENRSARRVLFVYLNRGRRP
jgi:DNA-directed RNA polymerase specialized sigma24 family protein